MTDYNEEMTLAELIAERDKIVEQIRYWGFGDDFGKPLLDLLNIAIAKLKKMED